MRPEPHGGVPSALAWMAFPLIPTLLGNFYHHTFNSPVDGMGGPDPREWGWVAWVLLTGPLLGYGFLAGATLALSDEPGGRGIRGWSSRRAVWVGIGPWVGLLLGMALFFAARGAAAAVAWVYPPSDEWSLPPGWLGNETWVGWFLGRLLVIVVVGSLAYGWLLVAWAALRRARRAGLGRRSFRQGLAMALGFVGSLFGTFWAITESWRGYFFDPRVMPILIAATTVLLTSGCASHPTYGEVRRRELFQALLMAWLLGMALAWRWWSRPDSRPRGPS